MFVVRRPPSKTDFPLVRSFLWLLFYWCILQKTASKKFTLFQIFDFSLKYK